MGCLSMGCLKGGCQAGARCGFRGAVLARPIIFGVGLHTPECKRMLGFQDPEFPTAGEAEGLYLALPLQAGWGCPMGSPIPVQGR